MDALLAAAADAGSAVLIVTHDHEFADSLPRTVTIRDGRIVTAVAVG
jgi:putative ABC transport system ATP-binding protein